MQLLEGTCDWSISLPLVFIYLSISSSSHQRRMSVRTPVSEETFNEILQLYTARTREATSGYCRLISPAYHSDAPLLSAESVHVHRLRRSGKSLQWIGFCRGRRIQAKLVQISPPLASETHSVFHNSTCGALTLRGVHQRMNALSTAS